VHRLQMRVVAVAVVIVVAAAAVVGVEKVDRVEGGA